MLCQGHAAPGAWSWELVQAVSAPSMPPLGAECFSRAFFPEASEAFGLPGVTITESLCVPSVPASLHT